jgi:2-phospho-L-lactate transferase/gluconeogenesis factor (CofD/UPF0052 family)
VAAAKLLESYVDQVTFSNELRTSFQRTQKIEVRIGDFVCAKNELAAAKERLRFGWCLFHRFEDRRMLLADLSTAVFMFKATAMLQVYRQAEEQTPSFLLGRTGIITETSDALSVPVVVSFLGEKSRMMSDYDFRRYAEPVSEVIASAAYSVADLLK